MNGDGELDFDPIPDDDVGWVTALRELIYKLELFGTYWKHDARRLEAILATLPIYRPGEDKDFRVALKEEADVLEQIANALSGIVNHSMANMTRAKRIELRAMLDLTVEAVQQRRQKIPTEEKELACAVQAVADLKAEMLAKPTNRRAQHKPDVKPSSDWTATPNAKASTPPPAEELTADQRNAPRRKEPSKDAVATYRYQLLTGKTQSELATDPELMRRTKRKVTQGTISRWLKDAKEWIEGGNILPDVVDQQGTKPTPIDPGKIDLGERQDGRTPRQRERRTSDDTD